jgi:hypothetical protein
VALVGAGRATSRHQCTDLPRLVALCSTLLASLHGALLLFLGPDSCSPLPYDMQYALDATAARQGCNVAPEAEIDLISETRHVHVSWQHLELQRSCLPSRQVRLVIHCQELHCPPQFICCRGTRAASGPRRIPVTDLQHGRTDHVEHLDMRLAAEESVRQLPAQSHHKATLAASANHLVMYTAPVTAA